MQILVKSQVKVHNAMTRSNTEHGVGVGLKTNFIKQFLTLLLLRLLNMLFLHLVLLAFLLDLVDNLLLDDSVFLLVLLLLHSLLQPVGLVKHAWAESALLHALVLPFAFQFLLLLVQWFGPRQNLLSDCFLL